MRISYTLLILAAIIIAAVLVNHLAQKGVPIAIKTPLGNLEFNSSGKLLNS